MRALVFGGRGQIGSYLVELLKKKGYDVMAPSRADANFFSISFSWWLQKVNPDEVYNMVSLMHAEESWNDPTAYMEINGMAPVKLLEMIKRYNPKAKYFQAGSAEVFDKSTRIQNELTKMKPSNPYGLSKLMAQEATRLYRERGLYACTGIFFNAESPRRKEIFFSQKVVKEAVRISKELKAAGTFAPMKLGRLDAKRDWGYAPEFAEAAWKMLQQKDPDDYVIGTGESRTCYEFVATALSLAGLPFSESEFEKYVEYDKSEGSNHMWADPLRIKREVGWTPITTMAKVISLLVEARQQLEATVNR